MLVAPPVEKISAIVVFTICISVRLTKNPHATVIYYLFFPRGNA
jgi:hypothetical protein